MVAPIAMLSPVNLSLRSPYSFNTSPGLPPAVVNAGGANVTVDENGATTIGGFTLQPFQNASNAVSALETQPTYDTGKYGDAVVLPIVFGAAGLPLDNNGQAITFVLPRPNNTRISLLIQNATVLGQIWYQWGKAADNVYSVGIPSGGNRNFADSVPQGNLSIYSSGAGIVLIEYMNANVGQ